MMCCSWALGPFRFSTLFPVHSMVFRAVTKTCDDPGRSAAPAKSSGRHPSAKCPMLGELGGVTSVSVVAHGHEATLQRGRICRSALLA